MAVGTGGGGGGGGQGEIARPQYFATPPKKDKSLKKTHI